MYTEVWLSGPLGGAKKPVHLFAGRVFCACGQKMYVLTKTTKYGCQKCHTKIPIEDLEAVFVEQLKGFVFSPEEVAAHLGQADSEIRSKEEVLDSLRAERDRVVREMEKIHRAYMADAITVDGYGRQYRPLEERLKAIEEELPRLQGEVDYLKIQYLSRDEILAEARDLYSRWPELAIEDRRQIVEAVVDRITIGKDDVEIHLGYLPSPAEVVTKGQRNFRGSWRRPA